MRSKLAVSLDGRPADGGDVAVADPQDQPAGVRFGCRLRPYAAERAAQAGGEPVAALHDVGRASARSGVTARRHRGSPTSANAASRSAGAGSGPPDADPARASRAVIGEDKQADSAALR